jgi:hypothetical protein
MKTYFSGYAYFLPNYHALETYFMLAETYFMLAETYFMLLLGDYKLYAIYFAAK